MWALAFIQMGVQYIRCIPFSETAKQSLEQLQQHSFWRQRMVSYDCVMEEIPVDREVILACHLDGALDPALAEASLLWCKTLAAYPTVLCFSSISQGKSWAKQVKDALRLGWNWQTVRHSSIGGLTVARRDFGINGFGEGEIKRRIDLLSYPVRPSWRFLEPSVKLNDKARKPDGVSCWRPMTTTQRCPWPWVSETIWVEAPTCFHSPGVQDARVERPLTDKERMQILDFNEDWGPEILKQAWEWNRGSPTPLRMMAEIIRLTEPDEGQEERKRNRLAINGRTAKDTSEEPWISMDQLGNLSDGGSLKRLEYFGWVWDTRVEDIAVATKDDDAEVNLELWAVGGISSEMESARTTLRKLFFRRWRRKLVLEAARWMKTEAARMDFAANLEATLDCVRRCAHSTWWEWTDGSRLLFWRWPMAWRKEARDGARGYHTSYPRPRTKFNNVPVTEDWIVQKDLEKLEKLLRRRYIVPGAARNTVPRFPVPKGAKDIRVVWDLAKNGLNECMFTPSFFLPTMGTLLRRITAGTYCGDFDIGEQFHNYLLHVAEQIYCGVDIPRFLVQKLRKEGLDVRRRMRWGRLIFGWQSSPYFALRMLARAIEVAKGAPDEENSAFKWERIELNLPGATEYDPSQPRVKKLCSDNTLASDLVIYFDDGRVTGATEDAARRATRQITSRIQFLGNQDAARKRGPVSQRPNAWAGGVTFTDRGICRKTLTQAKWDKVKDFLNWVMTGLRNNAPLDGAKFRSGRGFLLHVAQTFDMAQPYLKGFHLAENMWRGGRDIDGWKVKPPQNADQSDDEQSSSDSEEHEFGAFNEWDNWDSKSNGFNHGGSTNGKVDDGPPKMIDIFPPRLISDVEVLQRFFAPEKPIQVLVRPVAGACFVAYGAGDASGEGFGSMIRPLGLDPLLRRGFWCTEESEHSSNWRELRNLIDALHIEVKRGRLVGRELWLATDNSTAASAFYKGSSSSRPLHEMITELKELVIQGNFVLQVFHIAGTRMIQIGVDGLSRGELHAGALAQTPESAAPLHRSPFERSPTLKKWVTNWLGASKAATPMDWFYNAQQGGQYSEVQSISETWIWELPPAAAIYALEELGTGRLKRHELLRGIVIIPNLLQNEWRRRFTRVVDCYINIPAGSIPEWSRNEHEGLTIGFYFPLLHTQPWCWRKLPFLVQISIKVSKMYKEGNPLAGGLLRKFWHASLRFAIVPKSMVQWVLQDKNGHRFLNLSNHR